MNDSCEVLIACFRWRPSHTAFNTSGEITATSEHAPTPRALPASRCCMHSSPYRARSSDSALFTLHSSVLLASFIAVQQTSSNFSIKVQKMKQEKFFEGGRGRERGSSPRCRQQAFTARTQSRLRVLFCFVLFYKSSSVVSACVRSGLLSEDVNTFEKWYSSVSKSPESQCVCVARSLVRPRRTADEEWMHVVEAMSTVTALTETFSMLSAACNARTTKLAGFAQLASEPQEERGTGKKGPARKT